MSFTKPYEAAEKAAKEAIQRLVDSTNLSLTYKDMAELTYVLPREFRTLASNFVSTIAALRDENEELRNTLRRNRWCRGCDTRIDGSNPAKRCKGCHNTNGELKL